MGSRQASGHHTKRLNPIRAPERTAARPNDSAARLLTLQAAAGNKAVLRMLRSVRDHARSGSDVTFDPSVPIMARARAVPRVNDPGPGLATMPPALQRAPGPQAPAVKASPTTATGRSTSLELPWSYGDFTQFEMRRSGVRLLVAVTTSQKRHVRAAVAVLGRAVAASNALIPDPARRVRTCLVTAATTRFAYWAGEPVLILDPSDANESTVRHEMGHAIFDALGRAARSKQAPGTAAAALRYRLRVADLYLRLRATKAPPGGRSTVPVGLMMVDPSAWAPGRKSEHPWSDADELFASAIEAHQTSPTGLRRSIARAAKVDPAVTPLAKELLALLKSVSRATQTPGPSIAQGRTTAAEAELSRLGEPTDIEDSVGAYPQLEWLLHPATRPGR